MATSRFWGIASAVLLVIAAGQVGQGSERVMVWVAIAIVTAIWENSSIQRERNT